MSCLPCAKVSAKDQDVVKYFKKIFETTGREYYAYKLSTKEGFSFIEKSYFNDIFLKQIKPNFSNGAEYYHISEFKGN